jgi:hypothetical protein
MEYENFRSRAEALKAPTTVWLNVVIRTDYYDLKWSNAPALMASGSFLISIHCNFCPTLAPAMLLDLFRD